jgi:membrane-bound lytic murein transglycosylase D
MKIITALLLALPFFAAAQVKQVPHKMSFAGITLTIRDDARREIQKDVDALTQSAKHFNIKADRAKSYFPIIEKIFAEEGVPDDFKYLVLQESSLVADAVSVSNAVGFWQFKDFTAIEMGLRVDKEVDERMNIASSTRAAARYIIKNNSFFDNWVYALQAYQMGAGGVMRSVSDIKSNPSHEEITSKTYWYVRKFLAYKIAYEDAVSGHGQIDLKLYETKAQRSLNEIAREMNVDETELQSYNKWVRAGTIPGDRKYSVLVPFTTGVKLPESTVLTRAEPHSETEKASPTPNETRAGVQTVRINGVQAVLAIPGEDASQLASRAKVDLRSFLKWNDLAGETKVIPGQYYFVAKKRARAGDDYHTLAKGEDLWMLSQKYGVQLKKLKKYNRLKSAYVEVGTIVYLSSMKPRAGRDDLAPKNAVEVESDTFTWGTASEEPVVSTVQQPSVELLPIANKEVPVTQGLNSADSIKTLQPAVELEVSPDTTEQYFVVPAKSNTNTHVVQPRETLYAIAKVYEVGVMDLVQWNNLDLQQGIKAGQILRISDGETQIVEKRSSEEILHEVKASDTLYSIARKYGVTIKEIMEWNDKKDFSLSVGEKLKVKAVQ